MPAVLLFQDLAAAPQELQALAQTLRRAGLEVVLPRLPARDAPVLPFEQWLDRARDQFDALARQHGEVVVGGLGTGALQAQALGLQRRPAALLLLSPGLPALSTAWQQRLPVSALFQAWRLQRYLRPHLQDVQAPTLRLQAAGPSASRALDFLLEWAAPPPLAAAA